MAQLTYRDAVAAGIAQEMRRDPNVVLLGEDVAAAGGVFKATVGLLEEFGPKRVKDTPISEQAIVGAAMGAAMTGLRPIVDLMFSDFFAVTWDIVANQIAKTRYMTDGQVTLPLVIRSANGGGSRFGAQHSQSVENWGMMIPGLKIVAPAFPGDVKGMLAAAIRDDDPVLFFEHKYLYRRIKEELPEDGDDAVTPIGRARIVREGRDLSILTYSAMVHKAMEAAERLERDDGLSVEVVDLRTLAPLDDAAIEATVRKTSRVLVVHEDTRTGGLAAEITARINDRCFEWLDAPVRRVCAHDVPLPYAPPLEDFVLPQTEDIVKASRWMAAY